MLGASVVVIAIVLFLVINKFFRITYIGFGAIWKVFFVCLFISTGIVSGISGLFHSEKEPTVEEVLASVQVLIEDELIDLQDIQYAVDTDTLTRSMNEIYQEMEDRKSNIVIAYQFNVAGNTKVNLENKKIATKVNQLDELYTTYLDEYNRLIQSMEDKVNNQVAEVDSILGQMYLTTTKLNDELEKQLTDYSKRSTRKNSLVEFTEDYESYFTEVSSYRSKLSENMEVLSNYENCLTALDTYDELMDQLQFYLNEDEIERDLDSLSTQAAIKIRTFLKGVNNEQLELREEIVNQSREEIELINEVKDTITDEVLAEAVNLYLDYLTRMSVIDAENFYIYDADQKQYLRDMANQVKQLVEMYEAISGEKDGTGRWEIGNTYGENQFLSSY